MQHNSVIRLALFATCLVLTACANRQTATFDTGRDVDSSDVFFVERFPPDRRHFNDVIADNIALRGYVARAGEEGETPDDATVIVTYRDKWMWDMTNYMIELTITFRDPDARTAIASGNSYHTSLTRKSPKEMIDEVLNNIFEADRAQANSTTIPDGISDSVAE